MTDRDVADAVVELIVDGVAGLSVAVAAMTCGTAKSGMICEEIDVLVDRVMRQAAFEDGDRLLMKASVAEVAAGRLRTGRWRMGDVADDLFEWCRWLRLRAEDGR